MFKKLVLAIVAMVLLSGCKASLYDIPSDVTKTVTNWKVYENEDIALRFKYPEYYGEPELKFVEGLDGDAFYLRFVFENEPDDPYVIYMAGADKDFLPVNNFERGFYKGNYKQQELCDNKGQLVGFIQFVGDKCTQVSFDDGQSLGVMYDAAFLDATSNTVESVVVGNYPDGYPYNGLQIGFRVPFSYLFNSIKRDENGVERFIEKMDKMAVEQELVEELEVFRLVSDSIEFLTQ